MQMELTLKYEYKSGFSYFEKIRLKQKLDLMQRLHILPNGKQPPNIGIACLDVVHRIEGDQP